MKNLSTIVFLSFILTTILAGENLFVQEKSTILENVKEQREAELNSYYSNKQLGSFIIDGKTYFRLFTPNAVEVELVTFKNVEDSVGQTHKMKRDKDAVWEIILEGDLHGLYYGFKVYHKEDEIGNPEQVLCIDPYAKAVTTFNTYMNPRKSIVYNRDYEWEGDEWIQQDWRDLIIYEMHVRDMSIHSTAGAANPGTYKGLTEKGIRGGLDYIKKLGVNTVELLPAQEFGNMEIPFEDSLDGRFNTWNPYERNHWGYMTAAYFAPEAYYAEDWKEFKTNTWMGKEAKQVNAFKDMVKAFHRDGIAVMLDVVYNHLSEYELGNLKQIDKEYYFRLDDNGNFIAESYCGNDLKTERPMVRKLIIDSILYWMKEYHIDGFRFDLGKLIDWQTIEDIIHEAKKVNPQVVFVCEPWGGGYDPQGFSMRGWGAWNDQIRNGIKGENPVNGLGWIFGEWYGNNSPQRVKSYVNGTLVKDSLGLFQKKEHSVNYLESHDGYTLGDFIRIGLRNVKPDEIIRDVDKHVKLTLLEQKLNKLGALFLMTSQGITMIHSGQEFARSKVIPIDIEVEDSHKGQIDHNTYNKDNDVNYINYDHVDINYGLFDYYRGLIELRKTYSAFRHADYENINFIENKRTPFSFAYTVSHETDEFLVLFNADRKIKTEYSLPEGKWEVLVNSKYAGTKVLETVDGIYKVEVSSGAVLKKVN
ncbi:MAG: alpha-amylase family glycosyl hydrolase [Melioribacteraceae bacterium]|nr:MAG: alpha-amylase family glycosyl hydrolase [Melioribacteraceae bacterium]